MKKIIGDIIKVAVSIGLGLFLVWYIIKGLDQTTFDIALNDDLGVPQSVEWIAKAGDYLHAGDDLVNVQYSDTSWVRTSDYEGVLEIATDEANQIIGQIVSDDKRVIRNAFKRANAKWLLLSLLFGVISHMIRAYRWKIQLRPLEFNPRFINTFFAVMVGYLANMAFPRLGEVTRCGILKRVENIPFNVGLGSVVAERAIDLLCLILITIFAFTFQFDRLKGISSEYIFNPISAEFNRILEADKGGLVLGLLAVLSVVGLIFWLIRKFKIGKKVRSLLGGVWDGIKTIKKLENPWWYVFLTLCIWILYFLMTYICFFALTETSELSVLAGISVLVFGSVGMIVTQGGIGAYQFLVMRTLMEYGIVKPIGFALGWIIWLTQIALVVVLGFASLILLPIVNRSKD